MHTGLPSEQQRVHLSFAAAIEASWISEADSCSPQSRCSEARARRTRGQGRARGVQRGGVVVVSAVRHVDDLGPSIARREGWTEASAPQNPLRDARTGPRARVGI